MSWGTAQSPQRSGETAMPLPWRLTSRSAGGVSKVDWGWDPFFRRRFSFGMSGSLNRFGSGELTEHIRVRIRQRRGKRGIVGAALAGPSRVDGTAQPGRLGAENTGGIPQRLAEFTGPLAAQQHHLSPPILQKAAVGAFPPATLGRMFRDVGSEVIQHEAVTQRVRPTGWGSRWISLDPQDGTLW